MGFFQDTTNKEVNNSLWVEKYRPQKLDEYVGNEHLKSKVKDYLTSGDIPHLLFFGKAGTGKTTLAKLIVNSIDCDHIIINASDENNVDTVRNKVKGFASTVGFKDLKVIILDEFDYMTPNAQAILRNLMETFSRHCRFILTCNYVEKVISPIRSRTQEFQIVPPSKKEVAVQISQILGSEAITFEPKNLVPIIDASYPDIRKIINTCQLNSHKGELKIDTKNVIEGDLKSKLIDIFTSKDDKRNKYMKIRQAVADSRTQDFTDLYSYFYEKVDDYAEGNTANVILTISERQSKDALVVDKEIQFMALMIELLNLLN
jgi:replication factor C small subunit|tara:strand:+ start:13106 stop:14056 length:951 start_codon:yes stop_codon:yes gene_type:complete